MSSANDQVSTSGSDKSNEDTFEHTLDHEIMEEDDGNDLMDEELNEDEEELSNTALEEYKAAQERAGVIYISRIPPGMSPNKVRHLLSAYGEIGRVYLQQEDAKRAYLRKKHTTSKKPHYTEGWVEFKSKKIARSVAEMLNARPIGGKKGTRWAEDLWTMKYLPRFKWYMLTEQIAHERAAHTARLRMELSQSKREQKHYLKQVEIGKSLEKREEKRRKREDAVADGAGNGTESTKKMSTERNSTSHVNKKPRKDEGPSHRSMADSSKAQKEKKMHDDSSRNNALRNKQKDLDAVLGSIF